IDADSIEDLQSKSMPVQDEKSHVFVIDDDQNVCEALRCTLEAAGHSVTTFSSSEAFLAKYEPGFGACLIVDGFLPGMSGLELIKELHEKGAVLPSIMITGRGDVAMAIDALRSGARDLIEKPVAANELLVRLTHVIDQTKDASKLAKTQRDAAKLISELTLRQHEIMELVLAGHPSKNIAADLHISQRTVENHRATIMKRTASKSLPALARLAIIAAEDTQK
uniref:response regulator transcription factor n=1 Tax=uncultured Sphingomonas sp. TaxID=158754 RepID=UPI0035CACBD1